MKFPASKAKAPLIEPILPLINVVFLLLIFVMLMSQVESIDGVEVRPPVSESSDPAVGETSLLVLTADGEIYFQDKLLDEAEITPFAQQQKDQTTGVLKIKADANVETTKLISVMEKLRSGGIENLVLLTEALNKS